MRSFFDQINILISFRSLISFSSGNHQTAVWPCFEDYTKMKTCVSLCYMNSTGISRASIRNYQDRTIKVLITSSWFQVVFSVSFSLFISSQSPFIKPVKLKLWTSVWCVKNSLFTLAIWMCSAMHIVVHLRCNVSSVQWTNFRLPAVNSVYLRLDLSSDFFCALCPLKSLAPI